MPHIDKHTTYNIYQLSATHARFPSFTDESFIFQIFKNSKGSREVKAAIPKISFHEFPV